MKFMTGSPQRFNFRVIIMYLNQPWLRAITFVSVYAPTSIAKQCDKEAFYFYLPQAIDEVSPSDLMIKVWVTSI